MTDLRAAAQQALSLIAAARLCEVNSMSSRQEMLRLMIEATDTLRAALAEPETPPEAQTQAEKVAYCAGWWDALAKARKAALVEPVQEPYTGDVTRIIREAGMTFHLGLPHKPVIEQMSRVVDLVYAEASIKAAQQFAAPPQRPAEPVQEPVATVTSETGADISMSWWHEPALPVGTKLYAAPPQRKPLLASDIVTMYDENPRSDSEMIAFARAIEQAHGIGNKE